MGGVFLKYVLVGSLFVAGGRVQKSSGWPQYLFYYAALNCYGIAALIMVQKGDNLLGKCEKTGKLPWWSYVVFWPFHLTNFLSMFVKKHTMRRQVPDANEVLPNWWIGGWFSDYIRKEWYAIVDLTTEFPERSMSEHYLNISTWDGNPPSVEQIDIAAKFLAEKSRHGVVLCHCAFGVGRSTTVLCAALVEAGEAKTCAEALQLIKKSRPICRLNYRMSKALEDWENFREEQRTKNE